ncbi:hypothetical protein [Mesorhizobium amorphae]|uniref:hypothetical protein n=1 Tax=Mesorhizobium amorphae TaxID=71433 RepID=UPI001782E63D|nr:hypothetical protein [Mesorhizobium amorphae]
MVATDQRAITAPTAGTATQRRPGFFEVNPRSGLSPRSFKRTNAIQPLSIGVPAYGPGIRLDYSSPGAPCTFLRLLPIESKDGQSWLTNPSIGRRLHGGRYEKRALHSLRYGKNALPRLPCCPFLLIKSRNPGTSGRAEQPFGSIILDFTNEILGVVPLPARFGARGHEWFARPYAVSGEGLAAGQTTNQPLVCQMLFAKN